MGSQQFYVQSKGMSAKQAYEEAVEDANNMYGHQEGYSGQINATPGFTDVTFQYKNSKKSLQEYINSRLDIMTKHQYAECICVREPITNKNKIKTQVQNLSEAGTKKWVLKYVVETADKVIGYYNTKTEAVSKGRDYTERTQASTTVRMIKQLQNGNPIVSRITYKRASNEKEGSYVFYGWASC